MRVLARLCFALTFLSTEHASAILLGVGSVDPLLISDQLVTIDDGTGVASVVGVFGVHTVAGLSWAPSVPIPEPTTLILLTAGLAGIGFARKRMAA